MRAQLSALKAVVANPQLRRLQLAWMLTSLPVWGGLLALSVYAYERGGASAVGLVALLRSLPGAPLAPVLAMVVDRSSRRRVMIVSNVVRAAIMFAIAAAVARDLPLAVVYVLVALLAAAGPAFRPALMALLPRASRTPAELASANVVASLVANGGFLAGSLSVGALLAATSVDLVLALLGGVFLAALVPLLGVQPDVAPDRDPEVGALEEAVAGAREIRRDPGLREVVLITAAVWFIDGALDVLVVVAALDFLDAGEAGAGALNAVWAVGCMAGGAGVLVLLGRGHLTLGITAGAVTFGAATAAIGLVPAFAVALGCMVLFGIGFTLVEVALATLTQRLAAAHVLGRVGGVVEATTVTAAALGSLAAGLLADGAGARAAFVVLGAIVPVAVLLRARRLASLETGAPVAEREYQLLRRHEIFAPLSVAAAERLAGALEEVRPLAGETVIAEGEPGDRFYLVAQGQLEVLEAGRPRPACGPGDGIGEIALIRDVPRTATVRAGEDVVLLALERDAFLEAVGSQAPARRAAQRVADARFAPG